MTMRTEGLTVLSVTLPGNGRLTYDMAATKVLITDSGDNEALARTRCATNRIPGARSIELRCIGLPAGKLSFYISPVIVSNPPENVRDRSLARSLRLAFNGWSRTVTVLDPSHQSSGEPNAAVEVTS